MLLYKQPRQKRCRPVKTFRKGEWTVYASYVQIGFERRPCAARRLHGSNKSLRLGDEDGGIIGSMVNLQFGNPVDKENR